MLPEFAFSGGAVARAAELRSDGNAVKRLYSSKQSRVLPFWRGKPLAKSFNLCWLCPGHSCLRDKSSTVFVGMTGGGPRFAVLLNDWETWPLPDAVPDSIDDRSEQSHPNAPAGAAFANLRTLMNCIDAAEAELAAAAKVVLEWHDTHRFCPRCGHPIEIAMAGWQLDCGYCGAEHFCRTNPVVIMLVTRHNALLLGRSYDWPEGMHSLLAGFMEPGETVEAAVRRETFEEAGVTVGEVRYLASQPWPFPASLMLGCHARAESGGLQIDRSEIETALWVSRERMLDVFAGKDPDIRPPNRGAISEHLIRLWLTGRVA